MCPIPQGYSGAITQVDWTRFDSVGYTDAPCALGLGGPVHRRDGAGGRLPGSYKPGLQGLGWNTARG